MFRLSSFMALLTLSTSTALADDAIGKKLGDAKAAYQAALEKSENAIGAWFDKREKAARKDGSKKLVDQIKAERAKYEETRELPKTAPAELSRSFVDARTAMEAAFLAAVKEYTMAKLDDQASVVEKQLETFKKNRVRSGPNALDLDITADAVTSRFAASKATYDEQTGVLKLTYKFTDRKELKDFQCSDIEPKVAANAVYISAGQNIKHVVTFDTVNVSGVIGLKEMKGICISTTGGTAIGLGGAGKDGIYVAPKGQKTLDKIVPARFRRGTIRFVVAITDKRATLYWGNDQLGGESTDPGAGQVILHGGESGYAYGSLTITGKLNRDWAKKFFAGTEK